MQVAGWAAGSPSTSEALATKWSPIDACPEELGALDLVVVSVPISATPTVIREVAPLMRRGAVLAEIASLKTESHAALL